MLHFIRGTTETRTLQTYLYISPYFHDEIIATAANRTAMTHDSHVDPTRNSITLASGCLVCCIYSVHACVYLRDGQSASIMWYSSFIWPRTGRVGVCEGLKTGLVRPVNTSYPGPIAFQH